MTFEELEKLNEVARELNNLEHGVHSIGYFEGLLRRCEEHSIHGTQETSVTIDFVGETFWLPVSVLIENIKRRIKQQNERIDELKAIMDCYEVPDAYKGK